MKLGRILAAAVVGGIIMFMWGALSHMVLPLGEMGMKNLPAEEALVPAMKTAITERGFYMFPGMDPSMSPESQRAWEEKYIAGPRGIVVYDPSGSAVMSPVMLGTELASNTLAALLVAFVASWIRAPYLGRVLAITAIGIVAWLSIDVSYWNWYRFPTMFTVSQLVDQAAGWFLSGLAIAALVGGKPATSPQA